MPGLRSAKKVQTPPKTVHFDETCRVKTENEIEKTASLVQYYVEKLHHGTKYRKMDDKLRERIIECYIKHVSKEKDF